MEQRLWWSSTRPVPIALSALLVASCGGALAAASPALLVHTDPLAEPVIPLEVPLVLPQDENQPDQKIVPALWQAKLSLGADERLRVVVLLHEPVVPEHELGDRGLRLDEPQEREALRARLLVALEQSFVVEAAEKDFQANAGLSHLPIVFGEIPAGRLVELASLPAVRAIQPEMYYHATDAEGGNLTKGTQLRIQHNATGNGIGVAVLDTGIDFNHPEVGSQVVAHGNYVGGATGEDDQGHGTGSAGIIAGATLGMAPQARLWAIKVLNASGQATSQSVLGGLNAVYASRNDFGGVKVVNMSLGGGGPFNSNCDAALPAEAAAVNQLVAAGIAVVVSSGNNGFGGGISYPACLSNAISVGAVYDANLGPAQFTNCTDSTTAADKITCYSNSGTPLDLLAPSHCARTARLGGGFEPCFGGTSAAAPYVSGAAAQILSLRPQTTPAQLLAAFASTGRPRTGVNGITRARIDALAAYQSLAGAPTGPCVQDATTACVLNGRFRVQVRYRGRFDNNPADTNALRKPVTGFSNSNFETVFFYFNSVDNVEILLKMLDQGNTNPQGQRTIAVLFGSATPLRVEVTITDTQNGTTRSYTSPFNTQRGATDFTAFVR